MKVFLSWSGPVSKQVALAMREWLPNVIQAIDPWMSSEDIDKGSRWSSEVAKELQTTKAGILFVTADNQSAPWLNFEAGALSKTVEKEMVCPYLFHLKPSEMTGPLVQFQATESTKEDTKRMLVTLNRGADSKPLPESKLTEAFEMWWGKLDEKLAEIVPSLPSRVPSRSTQDMVEEVLTIAREQARTTQRIAAAMEQARLDETMRNLIGYKPFGGLIDSSPTYLDPRLNNTLLTGYGSADQHGRVLFKKTDFEQPLEIDDEDLLSDEDGPIKPE